VIAGGATRRPRFRITDEMVDAIETDDEVDAGLRALARCIRRTSLYLTGILMI
jgi:hypothetical protein